MTTDTGLDDAVNVAIVERFEVMPTTQEPVPEHAPLHPAKLDPWAALAVNVTFVPGA